MRRRRALHFMLQRNILLEGDGARDSRAPTGRPGGRPLNTLCKPWFELSRDAVSLTCEATQVIGLRMALAVRGDDSARREAMLMVTEKAAAALDAQLMFTRSLLAGEVHLAPARAMALYRSKVHANHNRLTKAA